MDPRTPMKRTGISCYLMMSVVLAISLIVTATPAPGSSPRRQAISSFGGPDFRSALLDVVAPWSQPVEDGERAAGVPGGIAAALRVMGGRRSALAKDYFLEVARIAILASHDVLASNDLRNRVRDHFKTVRTLQAFGVPAGEKAILHLSVRTSESRTAAEEILDLLGWNLETSKAGVKIAPGDNGPAAQRQITTAALALNQIAMQAALQSGKDFELTIPDEKVPVILGEAWWREALLENGNPPGGLSEILMTNLNLDYLYVGLSNLDENSGMELMREFGLRALQDRYARLLYRFSSSLVVRDGCVQLPGGPAAGPVWQRLVGASFSSAKPFLANLLDKDEGKMLAYFAALMQLDSARQKFFTASFKRAAGFYESFKHSLEVRSGAALPQRRMPLADFFRQIPLDEDGHVIFPGGPEVWMTAGGRPTSVSGNSVAPWNAIRSDTPAAEDDILANLARTTFFDESEEFTGLDIFLAVEHLNEHRSHPLDASSVLQLVRRYRDHRWAWPYLVVLGGLRSDDYAQFFRLSEHLRSANRALENNVLGELHGLLKILCLLHDSGRIDQDRASLLFREICDRFLTALAPADYAAATLDLAGIITGEANGKGRDVDEAVREALLEHGSPVSFVFHGKQRVVDASREQSDAFREVLELQKVPPLAPLLDLYRLTRRLSNSEAVPGDLANAVKDAVGRLPEIEIRKSSRLEGQARDAWIHCQLDGIRKTAGRLIEAASMKSFDRESLKTLSRELLSALNPQVRLALTGIVYAYYFCPSDLLVSDDPLFLRKHQFVRIEKAFRTNSIWTADDLVPNMQAGSFFVGGLADFGNLAGRASMSTFRQVDEAARQVGAALIGSLHETHWNALHKADLRMVSLHIRAAREWLANAPNSPEMLSALSEGTFGLLSPSRRAELLQALPDHHWTRIQQILTLSDLYFLGEEYLRKYPKDPVASPDLAALRSLALQDPAEGIRWLGANPRALYHCSHSHLLRMASYEYYEEFLTPEKLAARANEFKLYLAEYMERRGLPPEILGAVAEPMAVAVLKKMKMTSEGDWRAILAAYAEINDQMLDEVLPDR